MTDEKKLKQLEFVQKNELHYVLYRAREIESLKERLGMVHYDSIFVTDGSTCDAAIQDNQHSLHKE